MVCHTSGHYLHVTTVTSVEVHVFLILDKMQCKLLELGTAFRAVSVSPQG